MADVLEAMRAALASILPKRDSTVALKDAMICSLFSLMAFRKRSVVRYMLVAPVGGSAPGTSINFHFIEGDCSSAVGLGHLGLTRFTKSCLGLQH